MAKNPEPPAAPAVAEPAVSRGGELKKYFCGLTKECPFDYITVPTFPKDGGAFTFQKETQKQIPDGDGMLKLSGPMPGGLIEMFEDEFQKVVEYIESRGIIWNIKSQEEKRPEIVPLTSSQARNRRDQLSGNIEPLAKYVFVTLAQNVSMSEREGGLLPDTLLQAKEKKAATSSASK